MSAPVVVSRIQNRRGTQAQFNALYPAGYNGVGGFGGYSIPTTPILGGFVLSGFITLVFAASVNAVFPIGSEIVVSGVNPSDWNGTYIVTNYTSTTVTFASAAVDPYVSGGIISFPYNILNYPEVLMPGELALCTDTRNVFLGNLNGEYLELGQASSSSLTLTPLVVNLVPTAIFTLIPSLSYIATPFSTLWYDITDAASLNWNTVGINYSRNGQMQITVVTSGNTAQMTDSSTEINNYTPNEITFEVQYDGIDINIYYMSTLPLTVTFSTTTVQWAPF